MLPIIAARNSVLHISLGNSITDYRPDLKERSEGRLNRIAQNSCKILPLWVKNLFVDPVQGIHTKWVRCEHFLLLLMIRGDEFLVAFLKRRLLVERSPKRFQRQGQSNLDQGAFIVALSRAKVVQLFKENLFSADQHQQQRGEIVEAEFCQFQKSRK